MEKTVCFRELSPSARSIAVRQMRNSVDYAEEVLDILQRSAEKLLWFKLGLKPTADVVELNVAIRRHVTDLSELKTLCASDVLEVALTINTYASETPDDIIDALQIKSKYDRSDVCFSKLGDFTAVYSNANLTVNLSSIPEFPFSEGEELNTRGWIYNTVNGAVSAIHTELFNVLMERYLSEQIWNHLMGRNPECYESGYILV